MVKLGRNLLLLFQPWATVSELQVNANVLGVLCRQFYVFQVSKILTCFGIRELLLGLGC